jgi:hypothetical protein
MQRILRPRTPATKKTEVVMIEDEPSWLRTPPTQAWADVISAAELIARGDRDGAQILLVGTDVPLERLCEAAFIVFSGVMSGDSAASRFGELRADIHQLAEHVGAGDGQVILSLETVAAAEALTRDDAETATAIIDGSVYSPLVLACAAVTFCGQAIASWMGDRAPGFFDALRREYGIGGTS